MSYFIIFIQEFFSSPKCLSMRECERKKNVKTTFRGNFHSFFLDSQTASASFIVVIVFVVVVRISSSPLNQEKTHSKRLCEGSGREIRNAFLNTFLRRSSYPPFILPPPKKLLTCMSALFIQDDSNT